ncbi:hypothetical protein F52700_2787 [Fusarium sp. NRRL 52700]|nr:hypothetical protein F52700_2787 [Fusarium sp. NRRL 52700]
MLYAPLLSTLGCALLHASHAFEFTGPDSSEKLDLTQPITITWDANNGSFIEPQARALDLRFSVLTSDESGHIEWGLATNVSLSTGSYEWNPEKVIKKTISDTGMLISPDRAHTFKARLRNNSGGRLSTVNSDKYAVKGFDFIRNSAGKGSQAGFYTAAVAFTITGLVLLG